MELIVPLNVQGDRPLYEQIYQYIKDEIRRGNIRPEKQLPSSRELAKSLKVSRSTTQLAYEQLVSEGYLEAVPRKGYFAASLDGIFPPVARSAATVRSDQKIKLSAGTEQENARRQLFRDEFEVDFSPRGIDLEGFPYATWRKISRSVLKEEDRELFLKGEPQGDLILREAIRDYLHAARGVNCDASQIIIGAGNEYLLMLLSQLIGRDAVIAMENPTYRQAYRVLSGVGHKVMPVGIDKNGFCVKELNGQDVQAAYVMPSHQFPTGIVMPVRRRQELLSWAGEEPGRYLIEDDYDSEFRYKGKPIPALQGMDQNGRVIYMGTFSKAIAPAIRVGYMVLPESLLSMYLEKGRFYSSTVSRVDQRILANFISGGYFERHLNRMREIYKGKHDVLLGELKPLEKRFEITGEFAGLHVLLKDKKKETEQSLLEKAAKNRVRVYELSGFYMEEAQAKETSTIVLGYAGLTEEKIRKGVELLREAFD
ncbi:PLP-dependent aminotransferase family protein [Clostridium sp. AM30-24]|nr:PLP-dependent aminotransferase family protein [Clostridium sp. AM30-24]RHT43638.1 PLP-dependent aminotransferase family protein [Clostridium sp. AM30-24]